MATRSKRRVEADQSDEPEVTLPFNAELVLPKVTGSGLTNADLLELIIGPAFKHIEWWKTTVLDDDEKHEELQVCRPRSNYSRSAADSSFLVRLMCRLQIVNLLTRQRLQQKVIGPPKDWFNPRAIMNLLCNKLAQKDPATLSAAHLTTYAAVRIIQDSEKHEGWKAAVTTSFKHYAEMMVLLFLTMIADMRNRPIESWFLRTFGGKPLNPQPFVSKEPSAGKKRAAPSKPQKSGAKKKAKLENEAQDIAIDSGDEPEQDIEPSESIKLQTNVDYIRKDCRTALADFQYRFGNIQRQCDAEKKAHDKSEHAAFISRQMARDAKKRVALLEQQVKSLQAQQQQSQEGSKPTRQSTPARLQNADPMSVLPEQSGQNAPTDAPPTSIVSDLEKESAMKMPNEAPAPLEADRLQAAAQSSDLVSSFPQRAAAAPARATSLDREHRDATLLDGSKSNFQGALAEIERLKAALIGETKQNEHLRQSNSEERERRQRALKEKNAEIDRLKHKYEEIVDFCKCDQCTAIKKKAADERRNARKQQREAEDAEARRHWRIANAPRPDTSVTDSRNEASLHSQAGTSSSAPTNGALTTSAAVQRPSHE